MASEFDSWKTVTQAIVNAFVDPSAPSDFRTTVTGYLGASYTWSVEAIRPSDVPRGQWSQRAGLVSVVVYDLSFVDDTSSAGCERYVARYDIVFIFRTGGDRPAIDTAQEFLYACMDIAEAMRTTLYAISGYGDLMRAVEVGYRKFDKPRPYGAVYVHLDVDLTRGRD